MHRALEAPSMEFDEKLTAAIFVLIVALSAAGMIASGMMARDTVLTMVVPSMVVYGAVMLAVGVKYGEHRAAG